MIEDGLELSMVLKSNEFMFISALKLCILMFHHTKPIVTMLFNCIAGIWADVKLNCALDMHVCFPIYMFVMFVSSIHWRDSRHVESLYPIDSIVRIHAEISRTPCDHTIKCCISSPSALQSEAPVYPMTIQSVWCDMKK